MHNNTKKIQKISSQTIYHGFEPPTKTTVLRAMHRCPAAPKPAATRAFKVASKLASGITMAWFFAPMFD